VTVTGTFPLTINGMRRIVAAAGLAILAAAGCAGPGSAHLDAPPATRPAARTTPPPAGEATPAYGQPVTLTSDGLDPGPPLRVTVAAPTFPVALLGGFDRAEHGPAYTQFRLTITNVGRTPGDYNVSEFFVRGTASTENSPTFLGDQALSAAVLNPGETVAGTVAFDAGPHGELVYRPLAGRALARWPKY
jgi:hypothetical protein